METLDIFGEPLPSFNVKGQSYVHTLVGGIMTILLVGTVLLYATIQLINLMNRRNPTMSQFIEEHYFNENDKYNLNTSGFKIAFAIEDYHTQVLKDDTRYVKWIIRLFGKKDGEYYERILDHHKCTEEDYA